MLNLRTRLTVNNDLIEAPNLCDRFDRDDLTSIGQLVWDGYQRDKMSRTPWERRMSAAMDLAMQISQPKNFPWQGASNVIFPLVTIAALQFSARSYPAIISGTNVVRYRTFGKDPKGETVERAKRIGRHMSWQVLEEDEAWEEQHDRLHINLAVVGSAFIKPFFDGSVGHNVSELVMAKDLVIDYWAKSTEAAARLTHMIPMYRNSLYEGVESGIYADMRDDPWFRMAPPVTTSPSRYESDVRKGIVLPSYDADAAYSILEQHRKLDLDKDGYEEPYIVTIEESSKQVIRITSRIADETSVDRSSSGRIRSIKAENYFVKYSFIPSPDGGIYDLGFGAFLGPLNEAVSTAINQLLDSGTFQNSIGGFLGRGAKIRGGIYSMVPWEWKRVDSSGDDLRKNLVPFPDRQPLTVTLQLIELLVAYADRLAGTTDPVVGENPGQNTPAETSRNMTEQGTKVYSMIFKRVWRSMKIEFSKLYELNRRYVRSMVMFGEGNDFIRREDYSGSSALVAPVANPKITSTTMQVYQATAVREAALTTPGYNRDEAQMRWLEALEVENPELVYLGEKVAEPLPNPKVMIQQLKVQEKQMEWKEKKIQWANELLVQSRESAAKIDLLKAQAAKLISDIGADKASHQLESFELAIKAFEAFHSQVTDRISAMMKGNSNDSDGEDSSQGGVPKMAGGPSNPGLPPGAQGMGPSPNGAMGGR